LSRINRETKGAVERGDSLKAAFKAVTLDDVRVGITNDEKWMNFLF
jgi:hypothetical protein